MSQDIHDLVAEAQRYILQLRKEAFIPMPAGEAPQPSPEEMAAMNPMAAQDPAMMAGGGMPMDPAMMQGDPNAMPVEDPAAAGAIPAEDPAAAQGEQPLPPADPLVALNQRLTSLEFKIDELLASGGGGSRAQKKEKKEDPNEAIVSKLDQILSAIAPSAAGAAIPGMPATPQPPTSADAEAANMEAALPPMGMPAGPAPKTANTRKPRERSLIDAVTEIMAS